jgi:serine/threonine protein kinase
LLLLKSLKHPGLVSF